MSQVFSAVKALIKEGDKFLVLKQVIGELEVWDLPGGKVNFGESPYETLHREVLEETNLEVDIVSPLGVWWFFRVKDGHQVVCNTFLCKPKHRNIDLDKNSTGENISEYKWVTKEEFLGHKVSHDSLHSLIQHLE